MVTVITHITLKPTLPQAVLVIYSTARSKDVSEGTSRNICEETEEQGWPKDGTVTNLVCLAVKLLSELSNPEASKHTEEIQVFHIIEFYPCCHGLDNHSTSTSSLRRALGSILCPWLSAAVQVSGQNLWPSTTPCQQPLSDSCCCLTNLGKVHQKPSRQLAHDETGENRGVCMLYTHVEKRAIFLNGGSDERCNCNLKASKLAGGKMDFTAVTKTGLIDFPSEG